MDENFSFIIACYRMLTTNCNMFNDDVLPSLRCKAKTLACLFYKKSPKSSLCIY